MTFIDDIEQIGWRRKRLAEELGVSTETIRRWVKKDKPPRVAEVAVAALATGWRPE